MTEVLRIVTGKIEENCYILYQEGTALIVDPGAEADKIIQTVSELEVTPLAVLLTHCHYDHIGALEDIRNKYAIPVYVSPEERDWLEDPKLNLSHFAGSPVTAQRAEFEFQNQKSYSIDGFNFKVVPTPGHSPGSVSFIFDQFVLSGDALFKGSVGRTDLPGSNAEALLAGIQEQLFTLPNEMRVYPGHLGDTTIGYEKRTNPFFR